MDIVATFAPPRICQFGGAPYWVRPMTIEGFATLTAWVDDVVPGRASRTLPLSLDTPEAAAAMGSARGLGVLTWIALRDQGVDFPTAEALAAAADEGEVARLYDVLFSRRKYMDRSGPDGEPLSATWWGPGMVAMSERVMTAVGVLGKLTLDQIDCYATEGAPDEKPGRMTQEQVYQLWLANQPKDTDG